MIVTEDVSAHGGSDIEVENQSLPPRAAPSFATQSAGAGPSNEDYEMGDDEDQQDLDYPLRYYSDEVDTDPEDLDFEPDSRPTSPMSLTESERGRPDFSDVVKDLHKYDADPVVPPPPEHIQGALALYTEKELDILRNAYQMIKGRPARWFREETADPEESDKDDMVVVESADADEAAELIDSGEASGEDWVSL